ncbi:transposable element Tcb1 transposase [Trichonephila clavipes]|nr:transposable element Tcb1 transposase [Trichonephila clavipes]
MSRRKQRSAFDQVSEFDRGRIVAYRDCGLSFREIGNSAGRNHINVMRIWDRWMEEGTTDRRGRSHPPQCTTSLSARTLRRHLQQSGMPARRSLLGLPLTQNHRRLLRQWCNERRMWVAEWNEVVFADESLLCLQHHDGRIRVWRHREERTLKSRIMHRHSSPASYIMIELLPWPARSPDLSPIENMWSMVAQQLTQITFPAATPDQLWQRVEAAWSAVPQEYIQSLFESMPMRVSAVISNNGGYSGY